MARHLVLVRHNDNPPDDRIVAFAQAKGFSVTTRRPFAGEPMGDPGEDLAGTVIYGGPYEVYREADFPFLLDEARWIEACMAAGVPVLGICQGAQQIARVLGAWVGPLEGNATEFGLYRVDPTPEGQDFLPGPLWLAQSHFHRFDIPAGATRLASSALCANQAFRYGHAVHALQFHAEVTAPGFRRWQESAGARYGEPGAQDRAEQDELFARHDAAQDGWFTGFLANFFVAS